MILLLANWDPERKAPEGIFRGRAPGNAILEESSPLMIAEGSGPAGAGYRYTISIIPIEYRPDAGSIVLEAFSFQAEGYSLNVPEIKTGVLPARQPQNPEPEKAAAMPEPGLPQLSREIFMESGAKVFPLFRREYGRIAAGVWALWESGLRAKALAEIRRHERDSLAGPSLVPLRMEMERALSLGFTEDEKWRPLGVSVFFWAGLVFFALLAGIILLVFRPFRPPALLRKNVTSRRQRGFRTVIAVVFLAVLALVFLDEGLGNFPLRRQGSPSNAAVLEKSQAYRVPDLKSAVNARFGEGQPVIVGGYMGEWCYAESPDGRSGWVKRESVITY
jgi:hypothetical protein